MSGRRKSRRGSKLLLMAMMVLVTVIMLGVLRSPLLDRAQVTRWEGDTCFNRGLGFSFTLPEGWEPMGTDTIAEVLRAQGTGEGDIEDYLQHYRLLAWDPKTGTTLTILTAWIMEAESGEDLANRIVAGWQEDPSLTAGRIEGRTIAGKEYAGMYCLMEEAGVERYQFVRRAGNSVVVVTLEGAEGSVPLWVLDSFAAYAVE